MSALEFAKRYNRPVQPGLLSAMILGDLITVHKTFLAKQKLNLILRSKSKQDMAAHPGDLV